MNRFTLLITVLLFNLSLFAQPKITAFAPASGPIGTIVKITGTNFNTTADKNIVFFGAVKATVSAASVTSLTVTVPIGTTYYPITVTTLNNNLTAYSSQSFLVTFTGAGPVFDANSFKIPLNFVTGSDPYGVYNIDLDGDGKPDVANSNYYGNSISVLKNTSTINNVSYDNHIDYPVGIYSDDIYSGDLDGDGKPDLVATNWISNNVSVFRNTSVSGTVSFAAKSDLIAGTAPSSVSIGDIDGDGKPDLVITNGNSFDITIRRNTSTIGNISFANGNYFPTGTYPNSVVIRDFDGDGKPDLGISLGSANKMEIYRNTSTKGIISLVDRKDYAAGNGPFWIAAGDLDGDGKPDLAVPNNQSTTLSIYRNISTPGVISFATKVDFFVGLYPQHVAIGDLDGDGKPDLAVGNNANFRAIVTVFKNTCSVGSISFASKFDYTFNNWGPRDIEIGDVDGDKLPDIIVSTYGSNIISILLNSTVCTAAAVNTQPSDSSICAGSNSTFLVFSTNAKSYQWQENAGSGWNNLMNNALYSGCLTDTLSITGATVIMNNYQYRCILSNECGNTNSDSAKLSVISSGIPKITISTATDTICNGANVTFKASPINGG
ncbi:MAG: FG-GAP-like repeat-containing protein, partial [Chitinophagaceae bacterium]